jgi:hypothetical protein
VKRTVVTPSVSSKSSSISCRVVLPSHESALSEAIRAAFDLD